MVNNFIGGGQVFLHKVRMFKQVLSSTILLSVLVGIILTGWLYKDKVSKVDWDGSITYLNADFTYTDSENTYLNNGVSNPVGLTFNLQAGTASSGTFTITLRHEPFKDAEGVSEGDITNAAGETDVQESFDIVIE